VPVLLILTIRCAARTHAHVNAPLLQRPGAMGRAASQPQFTAAATAAAGAAGATSTSGAPLLQPLAVLEAALSAPQLSASAAASAATSGVIGSSSSCSEVHNSTMQQLQPVCDDDVLYSGFLFSKDWVRASMLSLLLFLLLPLHATMVVLIATVVAITVTSDATTSCVCSCLYCHSIDILNSCSRLSRCSLQIAITYYFYRYCDYCLRSHSLLLTTDW
jgi:hypothetical protein